MTFLSGAAIYFLIVTSPVIIFLIFRLIGRYKALNRTVPTYASLIISGLSTLFFCISLSRGKIYEDIISDSILIRFSVLIRIIPVVWFVYVVYYHFHRKTIYKCINEVKGGFDPHIALEFDEYIFGLGFNPGTFLIDYDFIEEEKYFFRLEHHMGRSPDPYLCVFVSSVLSAKTSNRNGNWLISISSLCNNKVSLPITRYIELLEKARDSYIAEKDNNKEKIYEDTVAIILKVVSANFQDKVNVVKETDAIVSVLKRFTLDGYITGKVLDYKTNTFMEHYIDLLQSDTNAIVGEYERIYNKPYPK